MEESEMLRVRAYLCSSPSYSSFFSSYEDYIRGTIRAERKVVDAQYARDALALLGDCIPVLQVFCRDVGCTFLCAFYFLHLCSVMYLEGATEQRRWRSSWMAKQLGISRNALHNHLNVWIELGWVIDLRPKGVRLQCKRYYRLTDLGVSTRARLVKELDLVA